MEIRYNVVEVFCAFRWTEGAILIYAQHG
jgi:hypothetical protein